jgi:hypothetical protein
MLNLLRYFASKQLMDMKQASLRLWFPYLRNLIAILNKAVFHNSIESSSFTTKTPALP